MNRRPVASAADYMIVAINPALIMLLVGSVLFFLVEVFYRGGYESRMYFICAMYVLGIVSASRLAMEQGFGYASTLAMPLAALCYIALWRFVQFSGPMASLSPILNAVFLAFSWWLAYRLTWDCTLLDEVKDASGEGLLQAAGLESGPNGEAPAASPAPAATASQPTAPRPMTTAEAYLMSRGQLGPDPKEEPAFGPFEKWFAPDLRPRAQGLSVVWFAMIALPVFGVMQWFVPTSESGSRLWCFQLLLIYVGSSLALLLNTSFLSLRRYLRQKGVEMPLDTATAWMGIGAALIAAVMIACLLLPRPGAEMAVATPPITFGGTPGAGRWGVGNDGREQRAGGAAGKQPPSSPSNPAPGSTPPGPHSSTGTPGSTPSPDASKSSNGGSPQTQGAGASQSPGQQGSQQSGGSPGAPTPGGQNPGGSSPGGQSPGGQTPGGQQGAGGKSSGGQSAGQPSSGGQSGAGEKSSEKWSAGQSPGGQSSGSKGPASQNSNDAGAKGQSPSQAGSNPGQSPQGSNPPPSGESPPNPQGQNQTGQNPPGDNPSQSPDGAKSNASSPDKKPADPPKSEGKSEGNPDSSQQHPPSQQPQQQQNSQQPPPSQQQPQQQQQAPPPKPNTPSNWRLPQFSGSFAGLLQWAFWGALVIAGVYLLFRHREELAAAWQKLLKELSDLWNRLFGGRKAQAEAAAAAGNFATVSPPRPFAAYANPFATGHAQAMPPLILLGHTLAAAEAFGRERGCPRDPSETPHEFLSRLAVVSPEAAREATNFAETYGHAAFGRGATVKQVHSAAQGMWSRMQTSAAYAAAQARAAIPMPAATPVGPYRS